MTNPLKILIPTDFSVQAEFAYLMVKKLEEKTPVEIHFIHVLNVPDTVSMNQDGGIETCGEIDVKYIETQKEIATKKLEHLKFLYGPQIFTHFTLGKVTDSILKYSELQKFDVIVMGTKGAWGIKERISGSETQIIARKSKIPVLSLMCDRSDLQIQHILLVHNFNHPVKEELQLMHKLVLAFQTKMHLLQICSSDIETKKTEILSNMKEFAEINNIKNYECHVINDKDVENGVIHFNQMMNMDIICIGTHGNGNFFHQSATEKLINHLFKPIISFPLK
ncbi:MAG: universal stress protein [Bacteroidetes bacterium]|nr:universal stress protein [Bacteroidota bacterium]